MADADDALLPLWTATAAPLADGVVQPAAALDAAPADAIVVGAGVTGLSTALHLAERGTRVLVLERGVPGDGSSGRANGQIIPGLQQPPDALIEAYGDACGERLVEFAGAAPDFLFDLVRRHDIRCDARRDGWIQATRRKAELDELDQVVVSWAQRGAPVRMIDRDATAVLLGTDAYAGGWIDGRGGTIQPLAYARGLARAAVHAGARIVGGVTVTELARRDGVWQVATDRGTVRAGAVVLATNVYTKELRGFAKTFLGRTYLGAYSLQLATAPLTAIQRAGVLPQGHACGDTSHLRLRYFRLDADGRFVIGGPGWLRPPRRPTAVGFQLLERSMRLMFPALRDVAVDYRWAARDTLTPDLLPHLYEPCPGLFAALGYNGRGLAIGTALGSVLAQRALGAAPETLPFPTTASSAVPLGLAAAARFYWRRLVH